MLGGVSVGPEDDHLVFSQPIQIEIPVDSALNNQKLAVYVSHYGDEKFNTTGLTNNPNATCTSDGFVQDEEEFSNIVEVIDGIATIYTCGASIFTVTYTGGPTLDNFVDNSSADKTITVTSGDIAPGSTITSVKVIVDFHSIDGTDPTAPGIDLSYSNEISFSLSSPNATVVNLLNPNTYTNPNAPRVTVTFDDSAGSAPSGLPSTGTFLPVGSLSDFAGEDPIGDWIFTFADNTFDDGLILFSVSLEIDAAELCGNGVLNVGEGCDDNNTTNGDGCSNACNVENNSACNATAPGLIGSASCQSGICDFSEVVDRCEASNTCGNNKLEIGEQCDDGNVLNFDGCSSTCKVQFCGNGIINTIPTNTTLFSENFESLGNGTITTNTTITSSPAYSLYYENLGVNGRARYGTNAVQNNGGAGAITLDTATNGTFDTNYVIFEIDLSGAAGATDLELDFDFSHHGEESNPEDKVWIRGSNTDTRLELYNRDANKGAAGTFLSVTNLDIDSLLTANSQFVSSTFQIRFGQNDNFTAASTTASDGLTIDNVVITGTPLGPLSNEQCDDGNRINNDGCNQSCIVESGYTCSGTPSSCSLIPAPTGLQLQYDGSQGGGLFTDISGNANDGTIFNGVTTSLVNGETVMCFNGTNQYIEREINLATAYPFTMSSWIKADLTTGIRGIMSLARSSSGNRMYNIETSGTAIRGTAQNTNARYVTASSLLNTSQRFLVTTVFISNTSRDIYINGQYEASNTQNVTYDGNPNKRLNIGRFADSSPDNYFDGCIDDVRFYTSELTAQQIYDIYAKPATLTTYYTTNGSPQLTGTIQGVLDTIALTISGNVYTGTNNGDGTRTLPALTISPNLTSGTYPTILTVTNPYGRAVTYNSSFIVDIPVPICGDGNIDAGEQCDDNNTVNGDGCSSLCQLEVTGDVCISGPSTLLFTGAIISQNYTQVFEQQFTGYFQVEDTLGSNSGYYTTLQIGLFSGTSYGNTLSSDNVERYATGVTLLSGDANADVVLPSGWSSYLVASGAVTFIKRDPGANLGRTGIYGTLPILRITIPPYTVPDNYQAILTYTLYKD